MPYVSYSQNGIRQYFKLLDGKMTIFGREDHVDFQIVKDSLVSREHCEIGKDEDGNYIIVDLGSSNGTYLNDKKLAPNDVVILKNGDKFKIGLMLFNYNLKITKDRTSEILRQVTAEYQQGKGYNTIMREIVGDKKNRSKLT